MIEQSYQQNEIMGHEKGSRTIRAYLSQEKLADFNLVNPYARKVFREHLLMEVADVEGGQFAGGGAVMLATFADHAWACCDRALNFDFDKAKQKIRNALSGMDYIAAIEAGVKPAARLAFGIVRKFIFLKLCNGG